MHAPADVRVRVRGGTGGAGITLHPLEEYVAGVLAAEAGADWPDGALQALAVVARTFGLYRVVHPRDRRFDVVASTLDHLFVPPRIASTAVRAAVAATSGAFLTGSDPDGRKVIARALAHTSCGGATDALDSVWGEGGAEVVARCDTCRTRTPRWTEVIGTTRLADAVGLPVGGDVPRITIVDTAPSGRARTVAISSGGARRQMRADDFRRALGYDRVRSTWFRSERNAEGVRLEGVGLGHGVGLCLHGARALARGGTSATQILSVYFPDWEST